MKRSTLLALGALVLTNGGWLWYALHGTTERPVKAGPGVGSAPPVGAKIMISRPTESGRALDRLQVAHRTKPVGADMDIAPEDWYVDFGGMVFIAESQK